MRIDRGRYLDELVRREGNGAVKVVTGLRRAGKSYLIFDIFRDYLREEGVPEDRVSPRPGSPGWPILCAVRT